MLVSAELCALSVLLPVLCAAVSSTEGSVSVVEQEISEGTENSKMSL